MSEDAGGLRSLREPREFGLLVIERAGERVGIVEFSSVNARSRIAQLSSLAVHPGHRGAGVAAEATRLLRDELLGVLGYHRLQLEIYGFNERSQRLAERVGFVREGVRRKAY